MKYNTSKFIFPLEVYTTIKTKTAVLQKNILSNVDTSLGRNQVTVSTMNRVYLYSDLSDLNFPKLDKTRLLNVYK